MFESLELDHKVSKSAFDAQEPLLRGDLIDAQFDLIESNGFSVIVLFFGMDVAGRSAAAKRLMGWMDSRHIRPFAMFRPSEEELDRPRMWRFWRALPRRGRIGVFLNSWYEGAANDYFVKRINHDRYRTRIAEISRFEQMLAHENTLLLKFLFYVPKKQMMTGIHGKKQDMPMAWKISADELEISKQVAKKYRKAQQVIEELVSQTSTGYAPWIPLASADQHYRDLTIGRTLVEAIRGRMNSSGPRITSSGIGEAATTDGPNILDSLDLSKALERDDYRKQLQSEQRTLTELTISQKFEKHALVCVFEGNDAAGKGGGIRRVVQALDPRMSRSISIAAPTDEEKQQPYLWRFWRHVPRRGNIAIFDRSWYGRVLVERVEGFCSESDWMRAFEEIRSFEAEMMDYGIIVVKFWLSIDKKEQLKRFKQREQTGYKRHKITDEDWRNRKKWKTYAQAVHDMVDRTSTKHAPWTLVEANDKYYARVKVIRTINERLKAEL